MIILKMALALVLVSSALLADEMPRGLREDHQGFTPEEAVKEFTVPPGFTVDLLASEPEISQPIAFTFDRRGRIWLAEGLSYPERQAEGEGRDRIVILEDVDGDGSFETKKVFVDNLNLVSGIELGFGGVYVGSAPNLLFIPSGADDVAGEPEILLDGWGYQDTHETLNSFTWGPDGWLYGCHGIFTHSEVGKPGTPKSERTKINAGIWRFHPVRKEFEVFAEGTSNPWGLDFNAEGEFFIEACVIPHFWHIIQNGYYQRQAGAHFNPYVFDDLKTIADHLHYDGGNQWEASRNGTADAHGGGHAHAGLAIYLSDLFPEDYFGDPLFFNLHGHRLNREKLVKNGSGWTAKHAPDPMLANDSWFIGVSAKVGPDGALYFIDWQDDTTCHHTDPLAWDRSNGRLFRLRYEGWKPAKVDVKFNMEGGDTQHLIEATESKNEWLARMSQRVVQESAGRKAVLIADRLREKLAKGEIRFRLRALWQLHAGAVIERKELRSLFKDKEPVMRKWALRLLCDDPSKIEPEDIAAIQTLAKTETSPTVVLEFTSLLPRLSEAGRWELAKVLAAKVIEKDDPNLARMMWFSIEPLLSLDPGKAVGLAKNSPQQMLIRHGARKLASRPEWSSALNDLLRNTSVARRPWLVSGVLDFLRGTPEKKLASDVEKTLRGWRGEQETAGDILEILALAGSAETLDFLAREFKTAPESPDGRAAFLILVRANRAEDLPVFLRGLEIDGLREAALQALQQHPDPNQAAPIFANYAKMNVPERLAANALLVSYPKTSGQLLQKIATGEIKARDLSAQHARQIRAHGDQDLDAQLAKIWGENPEPAVEMERLFAMLSEGSPNDADLKKGAMLFGQTCGACHVLKNEGRVIGPDLTGSNRANIGYLLVNILQLDAAVSKEFYNHEARLKNGQVILGQVIGRDEMGVRLRYPGGERFIMMDELRELKASTHSLMPTGILSPLSDEEIRDLIAFLQKA